MGVENAKLQGLGLASRLESSRVSSIAKEEMDRDRDRDRDRKREREKLASDKVES